MEDNTVLITGTSSGIGRTTAQAFLAADWTVYATARNTDDIEDLADEGCKTQELDVTDKSDIEAAIDRVVEEDGTIDCLVNNAGYGQFGPIEDIPIEALHSQFAVNVYGPCRLAQEVLPHMREHGDGTIINISSVSGRISTPGQGAYAGSKFALEAISDAMRNEVDTHGVDVVLIEPGPVATDFEERASDKLDNEVERSGAYEELYEFYEEQELFGGVSALASEPEEVAHVIVEAACSPDPRARYPVGRLAKYLLLARYLPDNIRDKSFRLLSKLA